jgi:glutamate racemase
MEIMPHEDVIYFGDVARVPYGTRSRETVVKYVMQDINFLCSFDIKLIIIACGTASSAAFDDFLDNFRIPIITVILPSCETAIKTTKTNEICVLGTNRTIKSGKYEDVLKSLNPGVRVISKACPMFVPLVENGYQNSPITEQIVQDYLVDIKNTNVDTIILGCTHFPIIGKSIQKIVGKNVKLIDSGSESANFAKSYLIENNMENSNQKIGTAKYFASDVDGSFKKLGSLFLGKDIEDLVTMVDIEKY